MAAVSIRIRTEQLIDTYKKQLESMPDHTQEARARRVMMRSIIQDIEKILED